MSDINTDPRLLKLNQELENVVKNFSGYHSRMRQMREYYSHSAMYQPAAGQSRSRYERKVNLLKTFANKNIYYTSPFPVIKVPTTGADPAQRQSASMREKILYAVHTLSNTAAKRALWAFDATVMSAAVAETYFDLDARRAYVRRHDPRGCYWQYSNDGENRVVAFWSVRAITKEEAQSRYHVTPTKNLIATTSLKDDTLLAKADGYDWFLLAYRWDGHNRTVWVGDKFVEEPHNHGFGVIPIDVAMPFNDGDPAMLGSFFLEDLLAPQAELNETLRRKSNIVRRMANPVIWGRGIINKQFDDVKRDLQTGGGGFVGLKQGGDLGVLQVPENRMLAEHRAEIIEDMMRIADFGPAAFGESVGANTSGDALGMYFSPTQNAIDHQNALAWTPFMQSINAKILRAYEVFGMTGEKFTLSGYSPSSTLLPVTGEDGQPTGEIAYSRGGFDIQFDKSVIGGNFNNIVVHKPVTPKDEVRYKELLNNAVTQGNISRTTFYEEWGFINPEDELALLISEQENPVLNANLMQQAAKMATSQNVNPPANGTVPEGTSLPGGGVA